MKGYFFIKEKIESLQGDMSNRDFAQRCGVSEGLIRNIKKGGKASTRSLEKIATGLDVEIKDFFSNDNQKTTITATNCRDVNTQSIIEHSAPGGEATMEVSERERQLLIGLREYFSPAEIRALEQKIEMRRGQVDDLA